MDGVDQLICCSVEGEVRGYKPMPSHMLNVTSDRNVNQEAIRDMAQRKKVNSSQYIYIFFFTTASPILNYLSVCIIEFTYGIEQSGRSI